MGPKEILTRAAVVAVELTAAEVEFDATADAVELFLRFQAATFTIL